MNKTNLMKTKSVLCVHEIIGLDIKGSILTFKVYVKLFLVVTEESDHDHLGASLGAIFILRKDIGVGGWSRKWQFPLTLRSENVLM